MEKVKNEISTTITPLDAKNILGVKLSVSETMELKQYYASLHNKIQSNKKQILNYGLIMMVGLPASGKTTVANNLLIEFGEAIVHLNQDEIGKDGCHQMLNQSAKQSTKTIILDRCNLTIGERNEWISEYRTLSSRPIICIYFNLSFDMCKDRLKTRKNHDMKNPHVITELSKKLQPPTKSEGFANIMEISDDNNLIDLYKMFNIKYENQFVKLTGLKKFVRTKHILNLGGAGRDDLLWSGKELEDFLKHNVIVEEKIDGANLGIFIEDDKIIIQNRSHYISPSYHKQFADIDKWKFQHEHEIREIIGTNNWIIYGEWVVAKHSIHYTKLPDKFILFDIYDRLTDTFYSRDKVAELIGGTSLIQIKKMAEGIFTLSDLKKFAYSKSVYYDGEVEGIYVRCFNNDSTLKYRGKIVRHNFMQEDGQHWQKSSIVKNIIV